MILKIAELAKRSLLNILFPPICVSCGKEGDFLCENCVGKLKIRPIGPLRRAKKEFQFLDGVIYGVDYLDNPEIQAAIKQFKYKFTKELATEFSELMVTKLGELEMVKGKNIILVPVPLHKKRQNYRGFNQAEVLASEISKRSSAMVSQLLERIKNTSQQARLSKAKRHENLEGAFQLARSAQSIVIPLHPGVRGDTKRREKEIYKEKGRKENRIYFLVDDICTTGATLENAARVLKKVGIPRVYGLVIARSFK